jgi:Zn-dependent protease
MADASFKIGRILGVEVELHWTFIALLLITLLLSPYAFLLIVLLFICVLIHELLHCLVSIRNGITVRKIILLPIGGASIIDQISIPPAVEFNVAIAGPLMSLLLGAIFGALVVIVPPGLPNQIFQFLFEINILLGVFNLLPAFPTDGGRVFRSYLERKHSEYEATLLTVKASKYIMVLFILGTVVYLSLTDSPLYYKEFVFLWNLLIVFFLYGGAESEKEMNEIRRASKGIKLSEVVSGRYVFVDPNKSIRELYGVVKRTREHILITKKGEDYAYVNLQEGKKMKRVKSAREIAIAIPDVDESAGIVDALQVMETGEMGIIAVTRKGKLVGVVTLPHMKTFLSLHLLSKSPSA